MFFKRSVFCFVLALFCHLGTGSDDDSSGQWMPDVDNGECGEPATRESIFGGEDAKPGEFPYMALMVYHTGGKTKYECAGSLINRYYVLTAAHCHTENNTPDQVILGEHKLGELQLEQGVPPPQTVDVEKVTVHEKWRPKRYEDGNDIALVRLRQPAKLFYDGDGNPYTVPVCLPWTPKYSDIASRHFEDGYITGWGKVTNDFLSSQRNQELYNAFTNVLQQAKIPITSEEVCRNIESYKVVNTTNVFCAGEQGKDSCQGDSGGPMVAKVDGIYYQIGIVSFGTKTCATGVPAVYTRVSAYMDWIVEHLEP